MNNKKVLSISEIYDLFKNKEYLEKVKKYYILSKSVAREDKGFAKLNKKMNEELIQVSDYEKGKLWFWAKNGYVTFQIKTTNEKILFLVNSIVC